MDTFECPRCHSSFNYKHNLKQHLQRKYQCDAVFSQVEPEDIIEQFSKPNDAKYCCKYCDKFFTQNTNRCRHQRSCSKNPAMKSDYAILEERIAMLEARQHVKFNVVKDIDIDINDIGQEDYSHITPEFMRFCIKNSFTYGLPALIEKVHFDPSMPQNKNVRVRDINRKIFEVRENNKWVRKEGNDALYLIKSVCHQRMSVFYHQDAELLSYDEEQGYNSQTYVSSSRCRDDKVYVSENKRLLMIIASHSM